MLDVVGVALALAVDVFLEVRRIPHLHVHVGGEPGEGVEHVPSGELVQAEPGDTLDGHVHAPQGAYVDHPHRLAVLVPDITHHAEQQVFVCVPVDLLEVHDPDGCEVVHELGGHLDLPLDDVLGVVVPDGSDGEHGLVGQIPVRIV